MLVGERAACHRGGIPRGEESRGGEAVSTPNGQGHLFETRELTRTFGHGEEMVRAVDEVSFTAEPGEIISIVGESGSGKTTLGRLLLRLLDPTGGSMLFRGQDVTTLHGSKQLKKYWHGVQA